MVYLNYRCILSIVSDIITRVKRVIKNNLKFKMQKSIRRLAEKNQNSQNKVYEYAMFLLGLKLRTEGELREKLKAKNYQVEIIEAVIRQLIEQHYVDDQRYAEMYLENLKKYKTYGFYGIKKKLLAKKLEYDLVDRVLSEGLSEEDEVKIVKRLLGKLAVAQLDFKAKEKIFQKLKNKGFRLGSLRICS